MHSSLVPRPAMGLAVWYAHVAPVIMTDVCCLSLTAATHTVAGPFLPSLPGRPWPRGGARRGRSTLSVHSVCRPGQLPFRGLHRAAGCPPQVLAGVRILFSRVIPLDQAPASHALWRTAEAFGAACTTVADAAVTHVVASTRGTEKVFWALQTGKHVVLPAWYALPAALARPPFPAARDRAQPRPRLLHPLARYIFT